MGDFNETLNNLRLLAGVPIRAEHGKRREQPVEQLDEARRANPDAETVIQGIKEIIRVIDREQKQNNDDELEHVYAGDKNDWRRILQLVYKGDQEGARRAVQRLDTAARDYISEAPSNKKTRKAVAHYLGVELLKEADNSNRQDTTDQGDQGGMQEWKPWTVTMRLQDGQTETKTVTARNKSEAKRAARQQASDGSRVTGEPERTDEDVVNEEGAGGQSSYQITYNDGNQQKTKTVSAGNKAAARRMGPQGKRVTKVEELDTTNEAHYYGDNYYPSHEDDDNASVNVVDYDSDDGEMDASTNSPDSTKTEVPQQTYNRGEESSETQEAEVKVPNDIKKELKDTIDAFRNEAERLEQRGGSTAMHNREFYSNTADAFEDLLGYLELGTIEGIKGAQIYASKMMGPMLHKIPTNTWKFIQRGGINRSLKSYMGQVHDDYPITGPRNTLDDNNWGN